MLVIRRAKIEDSETITNLTIQLGYPAVFAETKQWLAALLDSVNHEVLVAIHEQQGLCGWIHIEKRLSLESGYKAEISGLVVSSQIRRAGIGKQLIIAAESWALSRNLLTLYVRSNIKRKDSHPFYVSQGYALKKTSHTYEKNFQRACHLFKGYLIAYCVIFPSLYELCLVSPRCKKFLIGVFPASTFSIFQQLVHLLLTGVSI